MKVSTYSIVFALVVCEDREVSGLVFLVIIAVLAGNHAGWSGLLPDCLIQK
jgi:hypothetical protein